MIRSPIKHISACTLAAAMSLTTFAATAEETLTVVSWGGAYGAAQKNHMIDPFQKETGVKVLFEDYSGGVAEMKARSSQATSSGMWSISR